MLQVSEARKRLLSQFKKCEIERIHFSEALGRVLAEDITAEHDSPQFSHSAMDGVAVLHSDLMEVEPSHPVLLDITGKISAGDFGSERLENGQAVLIMTGAPVPEGADAVVRVEDTNLDFSSEIISSQVKIYRRVGAGENIRVQGENYLAGSPVLQAGSVLRSQDVGMLAMLGQAEVPVYKKPRVGIFSSGDELVEPGKPLGEGQIWNSNSYMLSSLVDSCGGEAVDLGIIRDTEVEILATFEELIDLEVDLILTSGGVSMGIHDYVRRVLEEHGELDFWRVNMRPGKPLAFGKFRGVPFVGLPGNPVSSFVGYKIFVCPAISRNAGRPEMPVEYMKAVLDEPLRSDGRESYLPASYFKDGETLRVRPIGNQSSGNLYALVQANCLIIVPASVQSLKQESIIEIWSFREMEQG
jgi:molybdopterin molybdotransferase